MHAKPNLKRSLEQAELENKLFEKEHYRLRSQNWGSGRRISHRTSLSFTEDIFVEPLLEKLKIAQLTAHEGEWDLLSHLDKYTSWMELEGASDAITYHAFPLTMGDKA